MAYTASNIRAQKARREQERALAKAPPPADFVESLRGKRVVIVGPAASLSGRRQGAAIDAYDVVVRLNLASPVPEERRVDVGSRTDVLYHVLYSEKHLHELGLRHTEAEVAGWREDGVQYLVARHPGHSERVRRLRRVSGDLPIVSIDQRMKRELQNACGASPNTGTLAIVHLLSMPIASLHVTGFDFYASGYYEGYGGFDAEQAARGGGEGIARPAWGQSSDTREIHRQDGQKRYLAELYRREPRLTFDDVAMERLDLPAEGPKVTALVPMKGHSERVPGKNLRRLNGKPLLCWTLASLLRARRVERVVVDTDSDDIEAAVREHFPAITVLRRPESLYGDHVTGNDLIAWELTQVEGEHFAQFHVTSPLLTPGTVDATVAAYFASEEHDSLFTVTEHHFWLFRADGTPVNSDTRRLVRSQDLEPLYEDNNAAHVFSRASFEANGSRIGERPQMFPIPKLEAIDIDYEEDFALAEAVMRGLAAQQPQQPRSPYTKRRAGVRA